MNRVRAADDFKAIRLRMEELQRERAQIRGDEPSPGQRRREPDAAAHIPPRTRMQVPSTTRHPGSV